MIFNSKKFKELRRIKNLSVQDVADELGVTTVSVYGWQSKGNVPDSQNLSKLAKILDTNKNELVISNAPSVSNTPWHDEAYQRLKSENERLWLLVQKLTGAQVADLGKLTASVFTTEENIFPLYTSVTKQIA